MRAPLALGVEGQRKMHPQEAYRDVVHPVLVALGYVPRGELVHAEGTAQDKRAGIDWIVSGRNGAQTTLATRISYDTDWGTFTIRYRTENGGMSELTKRYQSVVERGSYPTLTIQGYVTAAGEFLNAYVVRTDELYEHIVAATSDKGEHFTPCTCMSRVARARGGALFFKVPVTEEGRAQVGTRSTLIGCGVKVGIVKPRTLGMALGL